MKFGFVTCVQLGLSCIEKIYQMGGKLEVLITLKDEKAKNKSGRIYLDELAAQNHVSLEKIDHINDSETLEMLRKYDLDWLFIIGWSQIASKEVLASVKKGCIGMHPTLLPVGRGRAAIPWAIIKGLDKTGVSMFILDEGVDTGDILGQTEIELGEKITATELYSKVNEAHIQLISDVFPLLEHDSVKRTKQDESQATYWPGRKPEDGRLLESMHCKEADRLVRATTEPYPGAFFVKGNTKIIVWSASFTENQPEDSLYLKLSDGYLIPEKYETENI